MARLPRSKLVTIELNKDLSIQISLPLFVVVLAVMTLITLFLPMLALFTVPTYLALLFALSSDRISFQNHKLNPAIVEEE